MKKSLFVAAAVVVASSVLSLSTPATTFAAKECTIIKTPKNIEEVVAGVKALGVQNAENEEQKKEFEEIANMLPMLFDEKFNDMTEEQIATEIYNGFVALSAMNNDAPKNAEEEQALRAISEVIAKLFAPTVEEKCVETDEENKDEVKLEDFEVVVEIEGEAPQVTKFDQISHEDFLKHFAAIIEAKLEEGTYNFDGQEFEGSNKVTLKFSKIAKEEKTEEKAEETTETPAEIAEEIVAASEIQAPNTGFEVKNFAAQIAGLFSFLAAATFAFIRKK